MRVATFNLLHGRTPTDGRVDADRFAGAIAALDADVLALQEVDHEQPRSGLLDLTALAAKALGAADSRFAAAVVGTPGEVIRPCVDEDDGIGGPRYGVALVSRYPVVSWQVHRLSAAPVRSPILVPGGGPVLLRDEPRAVLVASIESPYGPLTVASTHLSFVPGWNVHQLRRTIDLLRSLPGPRLLLGDLNLPAGPAALVSRWQAEARLPTYPAAAPRLQLDHVLVDARDRGSLPVVTEVSAPTSPISDHRPLVATFG